MTDMPATTELNREDSLRQQQDLECLTLLTQAHALSREYDDIDRMLATLKGAADELPILP